MDLRSVKLLFGWSAPLAAAALLTGCGNYTSDYVPPKDGRARAVWQEDRVVASMPEGANRADCSEAVYDVQGNPTRYRTYYGGPSGIIIWRPWVVVTSTSSRTVRTSSRAPATAVVRASGGGSSGGGSLGNLGSGSSSGGGGGGGGDIGKAAVVLVVVAMLALPFITLGLGLGRPEPSKAVAEEIDKVNAYNDLARLDDSPCAVAGAK
jgi:hypothetical protein